VCVCKCCSVSRVLKSQHDYW